MPPVDTSHLISQDLVAYGRAHGLQVGPGKKPGDIAGDPTKSWFVPRDCWKCGARPGEQHFTHEVRAVDKVWSKPNKKGDLCCIFEDSSDDETVAAR